MSAGHLISQFIIIVFIISISPWAGYTSTSANSEFYTRICYKCLYFSDLVIYECHKRTEDKFIPNFWQNYYTAVVKFKRISLCNFPFFQLEWLIYPDDFLLHQNSFLCLNFLAMVAFFLSTVDVSLESSVSTTLVFPLSVIR